VVTSSRSLVQSPTPRIGVGGHADLTAGTGPEVGGPALAIVLAITGRAAGVDEFTADGAATLLSRMESIQCQPRWLSEEVESSLRPQLMPRVSADTTDPFTCLSTCPPLPSRGLDADVLVVSRSLRETHVRCDQDDKP
jgi:hypothetical protein